MTLNQRGVGGLIRAFETGEATPADAVNVLYEAIEARGEALGTYLALAARETVARQAASAPEGPLQGVPIAIKDLISTAGLPTTCGSKLLERYTPVYDATAVVRLKAAGAVVVGKTNLDEFGMGSSNENSAYGPARNPHDPARVAGGSSGGSAAAVASHTAYAALGTDTGGSVRLPAAFCGVVGLKPTYGLVSRYGLVAYASSLDQIGPIAKSVGDAALLLNAIAGHDPLDSTSINRPPEDYLAGIDDGVSGLRVGVPREYVSGLSGAAAARLAEWRATFERLGAEVVEVSLPHAPYALPTYYLISCAEASANLARFDGVRYTGRVSDATLFDCFAETRDTLFGPEVKRRVLLGTYALSAGYYEQFYGKAQRARALIKRDFDRAFERADVLLSPAAATPAFALGERTDDPVTMYLTDIYTVSCNLAGVPAISLPGGQVDGLPFGLQLIADKLQEKKLLRAARAFESAQA